MSEPRQPLGSSRATGRNTERRQQSRGDVDPFASQENLESPTGSKDEGFRALRSTLHQPARSPRRGWVAPVLVVLLLAGGVLIAQQTGLFGSSPPPDASTTTTPQSDLASSVRMALNGAGLTMVEVRVSGDVVTLSGSVPDETLFDTAEVAAFSVTGVATVDNQLRLRPTMDDSLRVRAGDALGDERFRRVTVTVQNGVVVLSGIVENDEERALAAENVRAVAGVEKVANRLTVGVIPDEETQPIEQVSDDELQTRVLESLRSAGYQNLDASVTDGKVVVEGVVPLGVLQGGFFEYAHRVEAAILGVGGVAELTTRLRLRGDETVLRTELRDLVDSTPIVFASGSSDLTDQARGVLDQAAQIIFSQPGLQVFVAGYTDQAGSAASNEKLAGQRGNAVYTYLISQGVPPSRLAVVAYGELFPEAGALEESRRIEFEVGP